MMNGVSIPLPKYESSLSVVAPNEEVGWRSMDILRRWADVRVGPEQYRDYNIALADVGDHGPPLYDEFGSPHNDAAKNDPAFMSWLNRGVEYAWPEGAWTIGHWQSPAGMYGRVARDLLHLIDMVLALGLARSEDTRGRAGTTSHRIGLDQASFEPVRAAPSRGALIRMAMLGGISRAIPVGVVELEGKAAMFPYMSADWQAIVGMGFAAMTVDLAVHHIGANAPLVLMPSYMIQPVLTGEAPDAEMLAGIRLPFPTTTVFFDPTAVPAICKRYGMFELLADVEPLSVDITAVQGFVINAASDDGVGLHPVAQIILSADTNRDGDSLIFIPVVIAESSLRDAILNAAAMLAWGGLSEPRKARPELFEAAKVGGRTLRKALKTRANRQATEAGALFGVRTLRLGKAAGMPDDQVDRTLVGLHQARSVASHWRRAHWRRSRVGPRADWRYEPRWIPPTVVHGHKPEDVNVLKVYKP